MRLRLVSPCKADWSEMRDEGGRRFCAECNEHVHEVSRMREDEVRSLFAARGRMCGKIAAAAIALAGCSAADQVTQPTVQIGPLTAPPPKPDASVDDDMLLGQIEIDDTH